MSNKEKYYLIESGSMLQAVKSYIESIQVTQKAGSEYARKMGAEEVYFSAYDRRISGLAFAEGRLPDGWKKPNKQGVSRPRQNGPDYKEFSDLPRPDSERDVILGLLDTTLNLAYENDECNGFTFIGRPFAEVGFLFPCSDGPYAFWMPDIEAYCKEYTDKGYTITSGLDKWEMSIDGVTEIAHEKWDVLVAEKRLALQQEEEAAKRGAEA